MLDYKQFEPENGWHKQDTEDTIEHVISVLTRQDVPDDEIESIINDMISVMMSEYGE